MTVEKPQVRIATGASQMEVPLGGPIFVVNLRSNADGQEFVVYRGQDSEVHQVAILTFPHGLLSTYRSDLLCAQISNLFAEFMWRYVGLQAELELLDP